MARTAAVVVFAVVQWLLRFLHTDASQYYILHADLLAPPRPGRSVWAKSWREARAKRRRGKARGREESSSRSGEKRRAIRMAIAVMTADVISLSLGNTCDDQRVYSEW